MWIQSVQYEVFTMNNMFVCIILFLAVRFFYAYWNEDFKNRELFLSFFIHSPSHCLNWSFCSRPIFMQSAYNCLLSNSNNTLDFGHPLSIKATVYETVHTLIPSVLPGSITLSLSCDFLLLPKDW